VKRRKRNEKPKNNSRQPPLQTVKQNNQALHGSQVASSNVYLFLPLQRSKIVLRNNLQSASNENMNVPRSYAIPSSMPLDGGGGGAADDGRADDEGRHASVAIAPRSSGSR
jgi:hypothetical protein